MREDFASLEKRRALVEEVVRLEVLIAEARRRGYDRDPELVRSFNQQLVAKMLRDTVESSVRAQDVPEVDVEAYYRDHDKTSKSRRRFG